MPMTAVQLRAALRLLALSQRGLARKLLVDPRTVTRWIAEDAPVPEAVRLLLDCWLREQRRQK
jgi:transposase-like protein